VRLDDDPARWKPSPAVKILGPDRDYEGARLPITRSEQGASGDERALRDPALFQEGGKRYRLYTVRGERGIAIAELSDGAGAGGVRSRGDGSAEGETATSVPGERHAGIPEEAIEERLGRARRGNQPLATAIVDLDLHALEADHEIDRLAFQDRSDS